MTEQSLQKEYVAKADRPGCWRCGANDLDYLRPLTVLAGNYHCRLCAECLNDWEVFMRDSDALKKRDSAGIHYEAARAMMAGGSESLVTEIEALWKEWRRCEVELFTIAETWTDDVIQRPKPLPPPPPTEEELAEFRNRKKKRLQWQMDQIAKEEQERQALKSGDQGKEEV